MDTNKDLDTQLLNLVNALEKQGIRPNIELKHRTSGYKGLHLQFEFNGIKSEIQLHTKQGWEIKKKQDEIYKVLRELDRNEDKVLYTKLQDESYQLSKDLDFNINSFASFELSRMVSSNSETSVLRLKSEKLGNSNQESFLNSKQPEVLESESDISNAYNRLDSTLSVKDNLSGGSGNKSLESMQTPLTNNHIIPQNLPEVYKHMLDEIDKQAKQDYKTSIDNLQNALSDTDFKATLLQGYKQVTDDAIESLGLDNQLTNTLIRETQKLESKPNISLAEAIELRKNINEIMRNYEKSSSDLKKFRANKHLDNIKDNIDNAIKNALDSKVAQNEAHLGRNEIEISPLTRQEADELFSNFQQANKNYAQIKESLNDKFAKALTKGMNKKDLDSRLTIEQWKQRVLDTQWGDSVKGLENTIFKNFNPRMQKHTQMLTILRALDRNVKLNDDTFPIDFTKILSDIENLEKLALHPEIYPILDTFKSYAKSYQFAQEISKAKALENQVGSGALATTLEGRIKVFLTNRLFKKLFAFIPYVGDNAAITKALQSAIKDLKYPSEITLETLKVLNKADLDKGFKPIKDKENKPRFEYKANTPLSDKELQSQIRGNTQILTPKDTSEIEALASNPLIQNMERQAKYNEELTQKISQFEANKENIQQDILNNLVVATQEIKQNTELLKQLAQQLTHNNPIHTPNKSIIKAEANNETYFITTDKNNITAIEKQELQLAQPKTYDELMQRDKNQNATLESYRDQYADIAEIKEAEAQKQLLLEYKPEPHLQDSPLSLRGKAEAIHNKDFLPFSTTQYANAKDTDLLKNLYGNKQEMRKFVKDKLNAIKGKDIVNKDGIQARLSSVGIAKMSSDKAIQKSLDNGFKVEEHFEAVSNIENLFIQSKFFKSETPKNQSKDIKAVHRFIADNALKDKEAQALITLKESFQNGNRIYSLELEGLTHPTNLNRSPKSKGVEDSHHDDVGATQTTRLFENHSNIIPQKTLKGDSITNPDISYAIQHENISKDLAEKIANNAEISNIIKQDNFNKASVKYYDKDNMTMYSANIGNYIDDEFGMKGDTFFLNNVTKHEFYIPPTTSLQDFKEQSLNQIEFLKKAIKTEIDNAKDEKELHKNIREIQLKARENAENRFYDEGLKQGIARREFYTTRYDEAMQEMANYYDKKFTNTLNDEIDSNFTYTTQETKDIKVLRNDLKEALNPYLNKEIVNKETGIIAQISTTGLSKISSKKAVDKSIANGFTRDEHFKVAQDLKSLFENSKLKESHADTKARDEIQAVHRFTKSLQINGSQAEAKITLFENNQAGNKTYSLELESLEKPTPLSPSTPQTKAGVADLTQSVGGDANPTNIAKSVANIIPQQTPQTKPYEVNENGRKYIEIPDDELADFEKPIKEALLLEPRQQELLKKINADSKDIDSYAEFMTNERKIMKGHEFTFNQQQEGLADRFLNMANSLENPRDRNHYAENILANMKHDIEEVYKSNATEFLAREAEKPFYKQMDKIRKETDEIVEALNKERDRLHAEKEAQLKAQQEAEKAAEIERIANYDLETAYKEKAHLEKIMQSNRNDYSPYSFSPAHNSEFLDKLDLVEQRIRDLKNKLPNKAPQENKPSKVEALKDFIDNARFQVNYAIKAKGTDTALKLIQQMIKDTNNTYEAKFLYRLKNEVSSVKELPTKSNLEKDLTQQDIKETIDKWDLTKPNANDKLIISKVEQDELELLKKDFDFKGNYAVVREIDAEHLAHALNRHSDEAVETSRNQIPITKDEALDYQSIIKTHDTREVSGNHIVYKKQINGHYVAVEEVLTGKNKLRFVTMWKSRGNITTAPTPSSKGYDLDRTLSGSYEADIIPQQTLESTMQKFNYDERKAKDLLEWHKDSSPLTKDENGLPKVFYHGTTLSNMKRLHKELKKPFEVFNTKDNSVSNFSIGNWFSNDKNLAKNYADDDEGNFIYEVFLNIKKPFIMEKELTQEKIKEIDKIFKFTKKDKERGLRAVENLKQAKAELKESGFEFLQYDRESVKIRHIESGKEFSAPLYNLKKEDLHESIRAYEADLKHNPNLDESLQELKELDSLLKKDSPTLYEAEFDKEFFKNETELYILAAARENEKLQEVVGGHYGVYGGYGRMYQTARIYPLQQFYKKAGYDGILFNDREIVAFDSNQIKHIDNKGSYTDTKGNITKTKPKNKESTHTYFNENSPNIMYANPKHLGSGLISGSVAGIETDENGNIVGFNPAKFAAGFLGGAVGSKAVSKLYSNESTQRYATLAIKSIQQVYSFV